MNPTTGSVRQSASSYQSNVNSTTNPKFHSTLINGLKKSGNGIVVKVPAGVKSINVRPMNTSTSGSSAALSKLQPTKITFDNVSRDNFITLRFDADGEVHATVINDISAAIELDTKMGQKNSKIGVISGENRFLNESKNLRIRESVDGHFNTANVRFLSTTELNNISARLAQFFKKFRSMTENRSTKDLSMLKKFNPMNRQHRRDSQNKKRGSRERKNETIHSMAQKGSKEAEQLKAMLIEQALHRLQKKIGVTKNQLKAIQKGGSGRFEKHKNPRTRKKATQKLERQLEQMEQGSALLKNKNSPRKREALERNKLLVGLFMDEKKRLFTKFSEINLQKKSFKNNTYGDFTSNPDNIEESIERLTQIEQALVKFEEQKERIQDNIRIVNDLIRSHGGYQILTRSPA